MTENERAAYIFSQSVAALAKIEGMKAENMQRAAVGECMAYSDGDFFRVIEEYGIGHNTVVEYLRK